MNDCSALVSSSRANPLLEGLKAILCEFSAHRLPSTVAVGDQTQSCEMSGSDEPMGSLQKETVPRATAAGSGSGRRGPVPQPGASAAEPGSGRARPAPFNLPAWQYRDTMTSPFKTFS